MANDFQPFAVQAGANVETQANWLADPVLGTGFQSGIAPSAQFSKAMRQASVPGYCLTQLASVILNQNVLDNGVTSTLISQMLQLLWANGYAIDAGAANAMTVAAPGAVALPAPASLADGTVFNVMPANSNTLGNPTIALWGNTAIVITNVFGNPLQPLDIQAGIPTMFMKLGGGAPKIVLLRPVVHRIILGSNLNLFVNTATGNDSNNGLAVGTPFLTIQKAVNTALANYDLGGNWGIVINVAGATAVTTPTTMLGPLVGATGPTSFNIALTGQTFTIVNGSAFVFSGGANAIITGTASVSATGTGNQQGCGVLTANGGNINVNGLSLTSTGCAIAALFAGTNSQLYCGNLTASGGGATLYQGNYGFLDTHGTSLTITGSPTFTTGTVSISGGLMQAPSMTVVPGTPVGPRYVINLNGQINTNGGGANYFPGNSAGTSPRADQYV